jgi:hypothetical protein
MVDQFRTSEGVVEGRSTYWMWLCADQVILLIMNRVFFQFGVGLVFGYCALPRHRILRTLREFLFLRRHMAWSPWLAMEFVWYSASGWYDTFGVGSPC